MCASKVGHHFVGKPEGPPLLQNLRTTILELCTKMVVKLTPGVKIICKEKEKERERDGGERERETKKITKYRHDRFRASSNKKYCSPKILIISSKKVKPGDSKKSSQHVLDTNLGVMGQMIWAPTGQA